jgi:hypothetical protein
MPAVRWKESDLQPDQHLLLREADPPATVPEPQAGDPGGDRPATELRGRGQGKGRGGGRFRLKAPEPDENTVLASVLEALLYHWQVADAYRMNTGAGKLLFADGTSSRFIRFGKKGSPDIHGYLIDGRALFVECKRRSGRKRQEQVEWIERAAAHGCAAFFARSVEDVRRNLG